MQEIQGVATGVERRLLGMYFYVLKTSLSAVFGRDAAIIRESSPLLPALLLVVWRMETDTESCTLVSKGSAG